MYPNQIHFTIHHDSSVQQAQKYYGTTSGSGVDLLLRLKYDPENGSIVAHCSETGLVAKGMQKLFEQIRSEQQLLVKVITAQRRLIQYNGHYIALLLGQTTEDESNGSPLTWHSTPKEIDARDLAFQIQCLQRLTGLDYSASDLADIFECDETDVLQALPQPSQVHCRLSTGEGA